MTEIKNISTATEQDYIEDEKQIREINLRSIGKLSRLSKKNTAALIERLPVNIKEAYPEARAAYRLGQFQAVFPMASAPMGMDKCEWSVVTDANTGEPLSLVPNIWAGEMEKLRMFFRLTNTPPIVILHENTVYWDEPKYSYDVGLGWIPLTTDEDEED